MQIELLKKYLRQPLIIDQLQFSIPVSNLIANGMEVNMETPGAADRDGSILDYCRLNDITIQAWSPLQFGFFKGCFVDHPDFPELNKVLGELAEKYQVDESKKPAEILGEISSFKNCIKAGGELDYERGSKLFLDDFRSGKIGRRSLQSPE